MATTRDLTVRINGDTKGLEKAFGTASKKAGGFKDAMKKAEGGSFALLGGLTAAVVGVTAFGFKSAEAANVSAEAAIKLRTNLLNVKGATLEHVAALKNQASELQNLGVIEDDAIIAGQSQLATFALQGKTIQALTPKIADMVAQLKGHNATAQDMVTINNLVGKVMTGNVGALSRYGVSMTDAQKEQLKLGNETERAAVLNEVLAQNYGKVNEALRKSPQGQVTAMKNTFGDFMEIVGEFTSEIIGPLIGGFNDWMASMGGPEGMMDALTQRFREIQPYLPIITGAIIGGLVPAFAAMAAGVWATLAPLLPFIAAGVALGVAFKVLTERFGGVQGIMQKLQPTIKVMTDLWKNSLQPAIMAVWQAFSERLLPSLKKLWDTISPILIPVLKTLGKIFGVIIFAQIMVFVKGLQIGISWISNIINWISNAIKWVKDLVGWFGKVGGMIGEGLKNVYDKITAPFEKAFEFIKDIPGKIADAIGNIGELLRDKLGNWDIPGPLGKVKDVIPGFATGVRNFGGGFAVVGERGPELVNLPRGADVFTASESRQMLRGGISGPTTPIAQSAGPSQVVNIDFSPTLQVGMFAGMPTEYREISERMWVEFTRIAKSNGINLQPIGARVQ